MSSTVLHQEIREKGGAYGAGATLKNEGTMNLWSYRDPHVLETYQAFEKAIQWASKGEMTYFCETISLILIDLDD